jgi:tetratricopeptide (TPR) repeat protein
VVEVFAGDNEAGKKEFQRVLEIQPDDQTALYNLGKVSFDEGKYDAALKLFRRYLARNSSDTYALVYVLRCGIATHDPGTVQRAEVQLRTMESGDGALHAQIGRWLVYGKFYEAADREFAAALQSADTPSEVLPEYASLLLEESRPQIALEVLARVPEQQREDGFYHYLMGECFERLRDLKAASREYSKAISIDPAQEKYHVSLASSLLSQKEFEAADTVLSSAMTRFPNSVTIIVARGLFELATEHPEKAMKYYRTAMQVQPDSPPAYELLGRIEEAKGD